MNKSLTNLFLWEKEEGGGYVIDNTDKRVLRNNVLVNLTYIHRD